MRRSALWVALLSMICLVLSTFSGAAVADNNARPNLDPGNLQPVTVVIDGEILPADAYIVNSRTMVPLRAIFEALGADIAWNAETWTVTATKGPKVIILTVGDMGAFVDGEPVQLAVPPVLINSRTFVPLRFVSTALGAGVDWDGTNLRAIITTGEAACALNPFQKHSGSIQPGGETWGACGSPHVVSGTFFVKGVDSPVLTITKGAIIQFESGASLNIGQLQPGGLVVEGTADQPVTFTAATTGAQPGFWNGIQFFDQAMQTASRLSHAKIEYGGRSGGGALSVDGGHKAIEVQVNDVEISRSAFAGVNLLHQGRLHDDSASLKIHDTAQARGAGGFPIITEVMGSNNLPKGEYTNNFANAVRLDNAEVSENMVWRNLGIPYASLYDVFVRGDKAPTLTIEPGTIVLFAPGKHMEVGTIKPGSLVADAMAPMNGESAKIGKAELDHGVKLASAVSVEPTCPLCAQNKAIVFGPWKTGPDRGAWKGIRFGDRAGPSKLAGVVIAYGGTDGAADAGLYAEGTSSGGVTLTLTSSMVYGSSGSGMHIRGNMSLTPDSAGNFFVNNGWPIRLMAENIGMVPSGQTFTGNTRQIIEVSGTGGVAKSATWRNHAIPYLFTSDPSIGSTSGPVVTIEPGTELRFAAGRRITVGYSESGSLIAVGQPGKPIKFTADNGRKGGWEGIKLMAKAGADNLFEYATVEYANRGIELNGDFGPIVKNCTFANNTTALHVSTAATNYTTGLDNTFQGNGTDQNKK